MLLKATTTNYSNNSLKWNKTIKAKTEKSVAKWACPISASIKLHFQLCLHKVWAFTK